MPLANTYSVGKITVTKNSVNFTGTGTLWKSAGLRDGDFVILNDMIGIIQGENTFGQPITSNTSGRLKRPWQGASGTYDYDMVFRSVDSRLTDNTQQVLEAIASGLLQSLGAVTAGNNKMPFFTGVNSVGVTALTEWARGLLAATDGGKGYEALGVVPDSAFPNRLRSNGGNTRTDPNNITESGWYRIAGSNADMPTNATYVLIHYGWSDHQARQLCYSHSVSAFAYERVNTSGTWGPWYRVYSASNILGAVSQDGNIPTGGIIQRGNNANGEFVKFADGTQICTYTYSQDAIVDQAAGVLYMSRDTFNWTFSASFVGSPVGFISVRRPVGTNYSIWSMTENITNTTYAWRILRGIDRPDNLTHPIYLCAIGRWR